MVFVSCSPKTQGGPAGKVVVGEMLATTTPAENHTTRESHMPTGILKVYLEPRGFGFIKIDGANEDVFFHASSCGINPADLQPGDLLSFDLGQRDGRPRAENVRWAD